MRFATGLNSTKATFLWCPSSFRMGCVIVSVRPPSGNCQSYG